MSKSPRSNRLDKYVTRLKQHYREPLQPGEEEETLKQPRDSHEDAQCRASISDTEHVERRHLLEREGDRLKAFEDQYKDELACLRQETDEQSQMTRVGGGEDSETSQTINPASKIDIGFVGSHCTTGMQQDKAQEFACQVGAPAAVSLEGDAENKAPTRTPADAVAVHASHDEGAIEEAVLVEDANEDSGATKKGTEERILSQGNFSCAVSGTAGMPPPVCASAHTHKEEHLNQAAAVTTKNAATSDEVEDAIQKAGIVPKASGAEMTKADRWRLRVSSRHAPKKSQKTANRAVSTDSVFGEEDEGGVGCRDAQADSDGDEDLVYRQIETDDFKYTGWTTQSGQPHASGSLLFAVSASRGENLPPMAWVMRAW